MPEGPEVKLICDQLNSAIKNCDIISLNIIGGRYQRHGPPPQWSDLIECLPIKINSVCCKGKFIYFDMGEDSKKKYLTNTLGMSGSWKHEKTKHAHIEMITDRGVIYFTDPRNFGTLKVIVDRNELNTKLASLGYDVLENIINFNIENFNKIISKKPSMNITKFLMDQKYICGIGNYLKAEILYASKISPHRTLGSLNSIEIESLVKHIIEIPRKSYKSRGSSLLTYTDMNGDTGSNQFTFKVYQQTHDSYGNNVIQETTKDGRTTHWVKEIQM